MTFFCDEHEDLMSMAVESVCGLRLSAAFRNQNNQAAAAPAWVGCHNPNHHPEKSLQSLLGHKNQKRAFLGYPVVCDRYDICDKLLWQMWQNCVHISAKFGASGPDCRDLIRIWSLTPLDKQRRSCREAFFLPQDQIYCAWLIKWIIKREIMSETSRYWVSIGLVLGGTESV